MFRLLFFAFSTGLARSLPLPILYRVADGIGFLCYLLDRGRVRAFTANLQQIANLGDDRRTARLLARRGYRHMATYLAEFFATPRHAPHAFADRVHVTGREHLDSAVRAGRGVLVLSAHYSNWELCASMIAYLGYPIHVVANQAPDPRLRAMFQQPRVHNGVQTLDMYRSGRATYKLLKGHGLVALMADRVLTGTGVPVQFFGRQATFPSGPARFSLGSGAPVVFTFIRRRPDRSYDLVYYPPLFPPETGEREANIAAMTQQYADIVQAEVLKDPTQYTVFFPIWDGTADRYEAAPSS